MLSYLRCIKSHRGTNDPECRGLSKSYLSCRMDRYVPFPASLRSAIAVSSYKHIATLIFPLAFHAILSFQFGSIRGIAPFPVTLPFFLYHEHVADYYRNIRNLMAPDSFKNLGFGEDSDGPATTAANTSQSSHLHGQDKPRGT